LSKVTDLQVRAQRIGVTDTSSTCNQEALFINQFGNMLELAKVVLLGALLRNESRGAHYKPDYPKRDDPNWLKTTKAKWAKDGPEISYDAVDTRFIKPRARVYDVDKKAAA